MSATPRHRTPRIYPLTRNAVTSLQLLNIAMLGWWTFILAIHHEEYSRAEAFEALRLLGDVYWWMWITGGVLLLNVLPLVRWWALYVNRTYLLKRTGLTLSAMWWSFLASMFYLAGVDLGIGIHLAMALACLFEVMRIAGRHG